MISPRFIERHLVRRSWLSGVLYPFSRVYSTAACLRRNFLAPKSFRVPCRVVSVGNVCAGGTGKTPFTIALAREMLARGMRPGISHRGYKGRFEREPHVISHGEGPLFDASTCGDEAFLLASSLPGIPVVAGATRSAAIMLLLSEHKDLDLVIIDDGFQHQKVHRDLDIVCFSASIGIGNGYVIPAGLLREPLNVIKPWHLLVINHKHPGGDNQELMDNIRVFSKDIHHLGFEVEGWVDANGKAVEPILENPCALISAIADPASFEALARSTGFNVAKHFRFPDHYHFGDKHAIRRVTRECARLQVRRLVCTSKDMTKLRDIPALQDMLLCMEAGLHPRAGGAFWDLLEKRIARAGISG